MIKIKSEQYGDDEWNLFRTSKNDYEVSQGLRLYKEFEKIWGKEFTDIIKNVFIWADIWGAIPIILSEKQLKHGLTIVSKSYKCFPTPVTFLKICKTFKNN